MDQVFFPLIHPRMYDELMTFLHHMYSTSTFILRETDDHRYPLSFKLNLFQPRRSDIGNDASFYSVWRYAEGSRECQ